MVEAWIILILCSIAVYVFIAQSALTGWRRNKIPRVTAPLPIHIIIPAHNEAECIGLLLEDLTKQEPNPKIPFRIVIVDDRSTDRTSHIVEQYRERLPIELRRIDRLPDGIHGKLFAMHQATTGLTEGSVLMVDADCRVGPRWVTTMVEEAGVGGTVGLIFEIPRTSGLFKEMLSDDQGAISFSAMGLIARSYPLTASTANMLIPVSAIQEGLWSRVGTDGTGEDGRILQDRFQHDQPMRAAIHPDAMVETYLAPTFRDIAAGRRRWYQDALTYQPSVQVTHVLIGLILLGLASAIPALFFCYTWKFGLFAIGLKMLNDFFVWTVVSRYYSKFTLRSVFLWSPLQAWFLLSYALMLPPKRQRHRGFADQ